MSINKEASFRLKGAGRWTKSGWGSRKRRKGARAVRGAQEGGARVPGGTGGRVRANVSAVESSPSRLSKARLAQLGWYSLFRSLILYWQIGKSFIMFVVFSCVYLAFWLDCQHLHSPLQSCPCALWSYSSSSPRVLVRNADSQAHSSHVKSESAFSQDLHMIHVHIKDQEAAFSNSLSDWGKRAAASKEASLLWGGWFKDCALAINSVPWD